MSRAPHRFALCLAAATLGLVFVGGLVTSTQSGLAVPDWPLSYGRVVLPMRGAVLYEHGHRLIAASIGLLTILTAFAFLAGETRPWLKKAAWGAVGLVVLQGVFGGLTVLFQLKRPVLSIVHACLAQTFFCLTAALSVWTSSGWESAPSREEEPAGRPPLHQLSLLLFLALFLQLILGAVIRHTGQALIAHMLLPGAVLLFVGELVARTAARGSPVPALDRLIWSLPATLAVQVVLGVLTYIILMPGGTLDWSRALRIAVVTAHVMTGALLMGLSAAAALFAWRTRPESFRTARFRPADYLSLTKPGISLMTALTALAGYVLGGEGGLRWGPFAATAAGTLLLSAGAGTLNMWRERDVDALMKRTESRPLPARRLAPAQALFFGFLLSLGGLALLLSFVNTLTAAIGGATLAVYVFLYTPLKPRSSWSIGIGAVAGALPPVMGWAAAAGRVGWEAAALFGILFFWQFPHFYALAWLYREDYARAGLSFLPVLEPDGESTARKMVTHGFALTTVSLLPAFLGMTGPLYPAAALLLGAGLTASAGVFFAAKSRSAARRVFLGSVIYLPLLLGALVWDRR